MTIKKTHRKIRKKVLFLCPGNSARSLMAEAILNHFSKDKYHAYSAGGNLSGKINPMAIKVLEAYKVPTHKLKSRSWEEYAGKSFDIIVTVCNNAADESCPIFPANLKKMHWNIPDPGKLKRTELSKLEDFYKTYRALKLKVETHF